MSLTCDNCVIMNKERSDFMNYFIKKYYKILSQLDNYKNDIINLDKKSGNKIYSKYINELDNLLLQKYVKFEKLLGEIKED